MQLTRARAASRDAAEVPDSSREMSREGRGVHAVSLMPAKGLVSASELPEAAASPLLSCAGSCHLSALCSAAGTELLGAKGVSGVGDAPSKSCQEGLGTSSVRGGEPAWKRAVSLRGGTGMNTFQ